MLIQIVAYTLPSYFVAVFLLPKEVLNYIDTWLKKIWWGFDYHHKRHFHPKAWKAICTPKEGVGIGLRGMEDMNCDLVAKLG